MPLLLSALSAGGTDLLTGSDLRRGGPLGRGFQLVSHSGGLTEPLHEQYRIDRNNHSLCLVSAVVEQFILRPIVLRISANTPDQ